MAFIHKILSTMYPLLRLGNILFSTISIKSGNSLRVLIYHDVDYKEINVFASQLQFMSKFWKFVSPEVFMAMMLGDVPIEGYNLLLTFDDGFASNRKIAEEILKPMGIKAIFFVVTDFIDLKNRQDSKTFIKKHIWPGLSVNEVPEHWRNMTWDDLAWLIENGHTVGAHTRTHARLSEIRQDNELIVEIIESGDIVEKKLGIKVEHFAFPFGTLSDFSPKALSIARKRYKFIYTGIRGNNAKKVNPWAIRRDAIAPQNPFGLIGSLLEGATDIYYAPKIAKYESWENY